MKREHWERVAIGVLVIAIVLLAIALWRSPQQQAIAGNCPPGTNNGSVRPDVEFRIYWCQPSGDHLEGAYVTGLPAGKVQLDNVVIARGPFADDYVQWSGAAPGQPRGNYTIQLTAQNFGIANDPSTVQDSQPSAPFALGVADAIGIPAAPVRLRIDAGNPTRATGRPIDNPVRR